MTDLVSSIAGGIRIFKSLRELATVGITRGRRRLTTPYRIEKLADDVFQANLAFGAIVTVRGLLSRYGPMYRPLTYTPSIPLDTKEKRVGMSFKNGRLVENREARINFGVFQFPVQALPPLKDSGGVTSIGFLYPEGVTSFLLNKREDSDDISDDVLDITPEHRPVPVLLNEEALSNFEQKVVTVTGVISIIPDPLADDLAKNICQVRKRFFYNFLREESLRIGFCLDCRDESFSDFHSDLSIQSLRGALYLEGHFQGAPVDIMDVDVRGCIPQGVPLNFEYQPYVGKRHYLTQEDRIAIVASRPGAFGFYTEVDLVDARDMEAGLRRLKRFQNEFRKGVERLMKDKHSALVKFKPDFIFDYRRQRYFHPEGVLNSSSVGQILERDPEKRPVIDWLRREG